jgi:hypothetical protein
MALVNPIPFLLYRGVQTTHRSSLLCAMRAKAAKAVDAKTLEVMSYAAKFPDSLVGHAPSVDAA